jgi:hypothetical protein
LKILFDKKDERIKEIEKHNAEQAKQIFELKKSEEKQ